MKKPEVRSQRSEVGRQCPISDFRPPTSDLRPPNSEFRRGQAILELVVGLVAMLVVFAGLLQIGGLNRLHTRAMIQARSKAANLMPGGVNTPDAHYIRDCTPGPDGRRYTSDDEYTLAFSGNFQDHVLDYAQLPALPLQDARPNNPIDNPAANPDLDMVHGYMIYTTNLFPIVRDLIYNADSIDVHADVFMTRLGGLP